MSRKRNEVLLPLKTTNVFLQIALLHYSELSSTLNLSAVPPIFCGVGGFVILSGLFGFLAAIKSKSKFIMNVFQGQTETLITVCWV